MPNTISDGKSFIIAFVFPAVDFLFRKKGVDLASAETENWSQELEGAAVYDDFFLSSHSSDPCRAPDEAEEDCLGLVFSMVGEENTGTFCLCRAASEEGVSGLSGCGFEREFLFLGESVDIDRIGEEGQVECLGEFFAKSGVAFGFLSS